MTKSTTTTGSAAIGRLRKAPKRNSPKRATKMAHKEADLTGRGLRTTKCGPLPVQEETTSTQNHSVTPVIGPFPVVVSLPPGIGKSRLLLDLFRKDCQ